MLVYSQHISVFPTTTFPFQIGTEEKPFEHKAIITMYGNVRSQELPVYGAKTIAIRHGTLELHGMHSRSNCRFLMSYYTRLLAFVTTVLTP